MYRIEELIYNKREEIFLNSMLERKNIFTININYKGKSMMYIKTSKGEKEEIASEITAGFEYNNRNFFVTMTKPFSSTKDSHTGIWPREEVDWENNIQIQAKNVDEFIRAFCMKDGEHMKFAMEQAIPDYKERILNYIEKEITTLEFENKDDISFEFRIY